MAVRRTEVENQSLSVCGRVCLQLVVHVAGSRFVGFKAGFLAVEPGIGRAGEADHTIGHLHVQVLLAEAGRPVVPLPDALGQGVVGVGLQDGLQAATRPAVGPQAGGAGSAGHFEAVGDFHHAGDAGGHVVLTDFFAVSNRALSYAAGLAVPLKAHLLLLHARHDHLLAPTDFEEYHTRLGAHQTAYALEELAADQPVPTEVDVSDTSLSDAVREVMRNREVLLVVLGQPGFEGAPPELVAHTAQGLLRRVFCPLLVIPAIGWDQFPPRRLLLAVDGEPFELGALQSIVPRLLRALHGTLEAINITDDEHIRPTVSDLLNTITQSELVEDTLAEPLHLHERHHPRIATGVLAEAAQQQADMLVVVARHRSFWGSLFHQSITAQLLQESPIPVLVLPAAE